MLCQGAVLWKSKAYLKFSSISNDSLSKPEWSIQVHDGAGGISAVDWDRCASGGSGGSSGGEPLLRHAFFKALEESGSASAESGWLPRHLSLEDANGHIHGILPFYVKSHSYGEYVFDHAWAAAWQQAGGNYYPKGQVAVPFSPVPGARFLIDSPNEAEAFKTLADGAVQVAKALDLSSLHITFLSGDDAARLQTHNPNWITRHGVQFHWQNKGYGDFDDFLACLTSRKRKSLRRERREIAAQGFRFHRLTGDDLRPHHWDRFYEFYRSTTDKKWGGAYLTRDFFDHIHGTMAASILLVMAEYDGDIVAGALNFIGAERLYGRNWGSRIERPFLHFETCYYQAIDFAIAHKLKVVEAGAQGLHKVQRGYDPVLTYSSHLMLDAGFNAAVADFSRRECQMIDHEAAAIAQHSPYRKEQ